MTLNIRRKEKIEVMKSLFLNYLSKIKLEDVKRWALEERGSELSSLEVRQMMDEANVKQYIGGGYKVELPFMIVYKNDAKKNELVTDITLPLNQLALIFEDEVASQFSSFILAGTTPVNLELNGIPQKRILENDIAEYTATYTFEYKVKGRFN